MLIAEISHETYLIKDSKDAEALLRVFERAKKISPTFVDGECYYSESQGRIRVEISISNKEILSQDGIEKLREEKNQKGEQSAEESP
ncbi:hypothetical protein [Microbulbifer sp. VAAF005]|uniref:hypothetical protein n=1 Tax=Microbulbifer sp. VAAF005 TaxID=3034230 RepID=UPI0024AD066E|nr:hypothetical protein [Microbulbifer sp. VAAF005]WHI46788.1 hypothetical protein P0078_24340 [Microbulbifer sp. VAAF005]